MAGLVNDQFGKDIAERGLDLNEAAIPALNLGAWKTHKTQDIQPGYRDSNSALWNVHQKR
jgi:hypothetical protein